MKFGAGIAQSVQRRATGLTPGVRFQGGERDFSLVHIIQTGSGAQKAYPTGTVGSFPEGKWAGA
jgi:hypothetical protein